MDIEQRPDHTANQRSLANAAAADSPATRATTAGLTGQLSNLAAAVLAVMILLASAAVYIPFAPSLPAANLDDGWRFGINVAIAKHLIFGKDLIFTFGPYGSVYTRQFFPATDPIMLTGGTLIAVAITLVLISLSQGYMRLVALALPLFLLLVPSDTQFFALPLLSLMLVYRLATPRSADRRAPSALLIKAAWLLTVPTLGMFPLIKGTFGICADVAVLFTFLLLISRRRFGLAIATAVLFLLSLAAFWVAAGQPIRFLPGFFIAQAPIITGYTNAMSMMGPPRQLILFIICCLPLWILGNSRSFAKIDAGLVLAIGSAMILFLAFKEGFVGSGNASIASGVLCVAGLAFVMGQQTRLSTGACAMGVIGYLTITHVPLNPVRVARSIVWQLKDVASAFEERVNNPVLLAEKYTATLGGIRVAHPLPAISGTADIYAYDQTVLLAHGVNWDPRPIIQSYSAYTPKLAAENAAHLTGPDAPDNIFFAVQTINNRVPALDDGLSWPILLSDYRITGLYGDYALLQHQTATGTISMAPLTSGTYTTDSTIALPEKAPYVWAQLDIQETLLGKLLGLVFKPPALTMTYTFPDGHQQDFRYVAAMGQSGFLLSPLVETTTDFMALAMPEGREYFSGRGPSHIRLTAAFGGGLFWHTRFSLKLSGITFPAQPLVGQILLKPLTPVAPAPVQYPETSSCSVDVINGTPIEHLPVKVHNFLDIVGWAAISTDQGLPADRVTVTVTNPDGTETNAPAMSQQPRPDVAQAFRHPALANSGFSLKTELPSTPGLYTLTINPSRDGKTWSCSTRIPLQVMGSETGGSDRTVH
ncbi:hypothetical protein [Acidisoma silvae]|uniref:Transmembrane protein n=1 Tax=Acidisoma silvae TaxID=2802396 RepID=A0A963YWW3_9PROT|nr:hypothetical protein [Acidisoma silvae]MCB8878380.1 hypothetical protein [Acidisoma silvae]